MCISHSMFFFLMTPLPVYFLLILDYVNYVRQKGSSSDFLEFKTGCNVVETPPTSTTHFVQELLVNIQCSGGLRSFAKET